MIAINCNLIIIFIILTKQKKYLFLKLILADPAHVVTRKKIITKKKM